MVTIRGSVLSSLPFKRHQIRRMLTAILEIDYTVTSNGFTIDALTTFLQSASTVSQLTMALQTSYPGVTVSTPTVTVVTIAPSVAPMSPSSASATSSLDNPMAAIIGGAVGGFVFLILLLLCGVFYYRHTHTDTQTTPRPDDFAPVVPVPGVSKANRSGSFSEFNPNYIFDMYRLRDSSRTPEPSTSALPAIS